MGIAGLQADDDCWGGGQGIPRIAELDNESLFQDTIRGLAYFYRSSVQVPFLVYSIHKQKKNKAPCYRHH